MFFFFDKYNTELHKALELPGIKQIAEQEEFYYQKAKDKFDEFLIFDVADISLPTLIEATKQRPFSFEKWLNSYDKNSNEYKLLLLIGQLISYFDTNAAMKQSLNEYEDKRVIAKSFVRQNYWVESLLRFKAGADINTLPENVQGTILYIQDPANNISVVSRNRRQIILDALFDGGNGNLFGEMQKIGISANNPLNNGLIYSAILHSTPIKNLWHTQTEKTSYWLGGSGSAGELTEKFIETGVFGIRFNQKDMTSLVGNPQELKTHIANISDTATRTAFELFSQMKAGDKIALKSSFAKGKDSLLRIKAIGTILGDMESDCIYDNELGHTIPVEWQLVEPYIDYELGTYRSTVHQVTKQADIDAIFHGKVKNLELEFTSWFSNQTYSQGKPYSDATRINYIRALKSACKDLIDVDLAQPNLFCITSDENFRTLRKTIESSTYYDEVNKKYNNQAFAAAMNKYEEFLSARKAEHFQNDLPDTVPNSPNDISTTIISLKELAIKVLEDTQKPMTDIEIWEYGVDKGWDAQLSSVGKTPWQSIYAILSNYKDGSPNPDKRIRIIDSEQRRKFVISGIDGFDYDVGITKLQWLEMLNNAILNQNDIELLRKWLYFDGQATCTLVGKTFNAHPSAYIKPAVSMARRVHEYTNCKTRLDTKGDIAWWNIPFTGRYVNSGEHFEWSIRNELHEALIEKGIVPLQPVELIKYNKADFLTEVYFDSEKYDDIVALLTRKKNIILQGAPGVGKSYMAKRLAYSIIGAKDDSRIEMIQFHQNYSYEDFIEGFRPSESGNFDLRKGIFYDFCIKAQEDKENNYFFIIDEINRGNLSKVMGELMLLLEHDKRGEEFAMKLTYSGEKLYVPDNIHVIGMMNTADRSLAMIDYALRRRFSFIPIKPAFDDDGFIADFKMRYSGADVVIDKMNKLNKLIEEELDSGHQIGHSYFCSNEPLSDKDIEGIFKYEIEELLREYFFDNTSKLEEVLRLL